MSKKRLAVKNKALLHVIKHEDKKTVKRNFLEILKRASRTIKSK